MKRIVELKALDDGRVRIHFFVRDDAGPIHTPGEVRHTTAGLLKLGDAVGYIACDSERTKISPSKQGQVVKLFNHTDDPRAATCPECQGTKVFKDKMAELETPEGRALIHWFVRKGDSGFIACERKTVNPSQERIKTHSDDPRASTCPECQNTDEFRTTMAELERQETIRAE